MTKLPEGAFYYLERMIFLENKLAGDFKGAAHRVQIECYPKTAEIKVLLLPADGREPISITQNLGQPMPPYQAFLAEDILDPCDNGFMALMEQNGLGYIVDYKRYDADGVTGRKRRVAAIFQFNQDALQRLTPGGCARYERHYAKLMRRQNRRHAKRMACAV